MDFAHVASHAGQIRVGHFADVTLEYEAFDLFLLGMLEGSVTTKSRLKKKQIEIKTLVLAVAEANLLCSETWHRK